MASVANRKQEKRQRYAKLHKLRRSDGMTNVNPVPIVVNMHGGGQKRGTVSATAICKKKKRLKDVEALLWFGAEVSVSGVGDRWNYEHRKVSDFDQPCNTIWKASNWKQLHFSA